MDLIFTFLSFVTEDVVTEGGRRLGVGQELRYNLATKVMRNGVEVIVATDRNFRPLETEYLRHLSSTVTRPITLAPHTLTNLMSMVLPTDHVDDGKSHFMSILHPSFITRTYYTTYDYPTKILKDNTTTISNLKTTIINVKTEEQSKTSKEYVQPTATQLALNSSPTLQTEVLHTTYTYWNTFLDGEQPIVLSTTHTLSNTLVGAFDVDNNLEPSEVFPVTNTYLKSVEFTQTLTDGTDFQIVSTKDLVTQVVVTDKMSKKANNIPITTDVTKTYFVTYTYFSTYVNGDQTKVKSDVSVSSDVTIEKFYIKPKKTETKISEQASKTEVPVKFSTAVFPFSILATKTYLTTFTYFTTLLQGPNSDKAETKINSRTKVVENTKSETISLQDFNLDYLIGLNSSLSKITGSLVATATLKGGEKIRITAHRKPDLTNSYLKYEIKPTRTTQIADPKTETYQIGKKEDALSKTKSTYSKSSLVLPKTKNTLLHKLKIKSTKTSVQEATAEALFASETKTDFISMTPTVTLTPATTSFLNKNFSTESSVTLSSTSVLPPKEVTSIFNEHILKDQNEESSKVSEEDPSKKKPAVKYPEAAMNVSNLLNLNSLGINGMNVLGPVFNAMAELIHNNLNKNVDSLNRRNDTVSSVKEAEIVVKKPTTNSINPLLSFVNKFTPSSGKGTSEPKVKLTTPRTPVYIPVGSFAKDSEFSESQDAEAVANMPENWHNKWTDTHAKNFEKGRPHDPPITILEGGIPISPGQVITTNSDVIIGRPGESGPRPPTFAVKNNFPIDMKPPPLLPQPVFSGEDEDGFLDQHSTNQGVDFNANQEHNIKPSRPPLLPPKKHPQENHKIPRPHLNDRYKNHHKNPHSGKLSYIDYDSGTVDLNPPPVPPPPVRSHDVHRPVTVNHEQKDESESYKGSNHILSIPVHFGQNQNVKNYINQAEIHPPVLGVPTLPGLGQIHQENIHHILNEPTPNINPNPNGILLIPTMAQAPLNLIATENSNSVDRSTGQLLVNIQPSQVANIVIPHGSSTALILSDGKQHSLKGEVIDDPSPHPEPETVGFVGAEPVLKIENEDFSTAIHNDVIPSEAAAVSLHSGQENRVLFSNRPHLTTELIKIRPKPLNDGSKGQDFYNLHLATGPDSQQLYLEQQQLSHLSLPGGQGSHSAIPIRPQYIENHRQKENHKNEGDLQIPTSYFGGLKPGGKIQSNLHKNHENAGPKINVNQNGNEGSSTGANFLHHIKEMHKSQNLPSEVHLIQNQQKHHNYFFNSGGVQAEQNKFVQGSNPVGGGSGIYVDISPPGHLPPRPNVNLLHQNPSTDKHQSIINEHLLNHQSGLVHDVPLNAQVQLGTGQKEKNPLKEILISSNTNKHDSIYDPKKKTVENKFSESQNHHKRPLPELPENLSPPPLNKEGNYRIHRPPPFKAPHLISPFQRHPTYPHPSVSKPVDFMMPPPQISHRPNQKPHSEHYERPVIPVGAGAPQQNYPNPRPEDILIVPNKNRPGGSILNYANNINHEIHHQTLSGSSDFDISYARDPIKTEYGEEIQESISRPLFPGQLPAELQKLNSSNLHNHKNIDASKKPKVPQENKPKDNTSKPRPKPEAGSESQKENLTNVSTQWTIDFYNKQYPVHGTSGINHEKTSGISSGSHGSFFSLIKKPSGFVTASNANIAINNNAGFANHRISPNLANHKTQTSESPKISPSKGGVGIRIHAVGPSVLPSGFVKNENSIVHKRPAAFDGELTESETSTSASNKLQTAGIIKEFSSTSIKTTLNDDSSIFGLKAKQKPGSGNNLNDLNDKTGGGSKIFSGSLSNFDQNKKPGSHETQSNDPLVETKTSGSNHKFGTHNVLDQNKPSAAQEPEGATSTIKFNSNKVGNGHPSAATSEIHNPGSNKPHRYSAIDFTSNQSKKTNIRPSAFSTPKKEESKISGNFALEGNASSVTDVKLPQKHPGAIHSGGSVKIPSGFTLKEETNHSFATVSNHSYGNKTIHFYEPKPMFDVNEERDGTYNKAEGNVDKWFASNFGGNGNAEINNKATNKLTPVITHRNVSFLSSTDLSTDSDVHITLLTPPKVGDGRPKSEDVMGLSPPPLERPRRPPQTHRPKPPFKFEIPTTAKPTLPPIAIENDFPPVRSPDFNRKPIKPQDIFPPRLPDNFIHHLPDFSIRNHPKLRPQERPVTSMAIDTPASSSTEKNIYSANEEENNGRDTYFSSSEINGHSKPIVDTQPNINSLRPPPPSPPFNNKIKTSSSESSTIYQQPSKSTAYQQPPKIRTNERIKSETPSSTQILSTPSVNSAAETTFHTKVSASVTPTTVQTQKDWQYSDIITGSETIFDPDKFSSYVTPTMQDFTTKKNIVTTLISSGSTTIFGNLYTLGSKDTPKTVKSTPSFNTKEEETVKDKNTAEEIIITPTNTALPVHTMTLTVTTTMTTVVHSIGHKPFIKTIVLTKTLISTVFNKITETKTLVKPTTATVIQTRTIATTKTALVVPTALYPTQTKYPLGGTLKPEIFLADPHAKDTMTISVSSSMNKNKHGEDKRKPAGTRIDHSGKNSILVFMADKHPDINLSADDNNNIDVISEEDNDINESRVVVGGVFDANNEKEYKGKNKEVECSPGCKAKRNELCQRIEGIMKCVCRPGFARMFPDRPCRPTYTYNVKIMLEKFGSEQITHEKNFAQLSTPNKAELVSATKEGLDRMIMQSDLRDIYHGIMLNGFEGKEKKTMVDFYVQLSENTEEGKLKEILKKTLQTSNYSLGGTELFAARESGSLYAEDFNECLSTKFHDCSENARCFNLKGTYTCSCKEGFTDLSENSQFPGRICSDTIGCEYCGYHGACYSKGEGQITCECFQWYSGERCQINLKVLLIALVTIGAILLALLLVCAVMTCLNRRSRSSTASRANGSSGYLRYRGPSNQSLDRRAMIGDSSSESSVDNLPYICSPPLPSSEAMSAKKKPVLRHAKGPAPRPVAPPGMDQRDRAVTVMIPRAKYRPMPPLSPHLTMSTFSPDKHLSKTAAQLATEQKLISYLDGSSREDRTHISSIQATRQSKEQQKSSEYKTQSINIQGSPKTAEKKKDSKVFEYEYKISNMLFTEETNSADKRSFKSLDDRFRRHSDSTQLNSDASNRNKFRKYSAGALVSAGYEVSAKVGMHHLEEDTTEDDHSAIINTHTMKSNRSQFTTLNRTGDHKTMSEARSYDETTVHPPTRSLKTHYSGSSPSSRVNNDEGHTMIERDLGSTFIMPESQLFKPEADRGSDISNFDSL